MLRRLWRWLTAAPLEPPACPECGCPAAVLLDASSEVKLYRCADDGCRWCFVRSDAPTGGTPG